MQVISVRRARSGATGGICPEGAGARRTLIDRAAGNIHTRPAV
jgi:hypothetical protein